MSEEDMTSQVNRVNRRIPYSISGWLFAVCIHVLYVGDDDEYEAESWIRIRRVETGHLSAFACGRMRSGLLA